MCDKLKECPSCGKEGWSRNDGDLQMIFCDNRHCPLWEVFFTRPQWQARPIEDRLRAERDETAEDLKKAGVELNRARGWAAAVIKQCDERNAEFCESNGIRPTAIELPEFDNWGLDD